VAYYALVSAEQLSAAELPEQIALAEVQDDLRVGGKIVKLAFDHGEIVQTALTRLRGKVSYSPVGFELLPEQFTLRQLQEIHEAILGYKLNKDSFRRKMLASGGLEASGSKEEGMGFRPAQLYRRKESA
jgi:8-oxo-dGTP diphosphatase